MPFIPQFHFDSPSEKLQPEWCKKVVQWAWYNSRHHSLLDNKKTNEIEAYASGEFDMTPFKRMFKSMRKQIDANNPNTANAYNTQTTDTTGLDWTCHAAIPTKLNSAVSIVQKIPIEITCTAADPLAAKKKQEDLNFLKNKPTLEADLQDIADRMGIGKVDLGTTKYSAVPFSDSPYGLDLNEPDELDVFVNLLYSLAVETSFETVLQEFYEIKKASQIKLQEIKDQFKFGVSAHSAYESSITGLPDIDYEYPDNIRVPYSNLPDYSDNDYRFKEKSVTAMELFNLFGNEIGSIETFDNILNAPVTGYCACNDRDIIHKNQWDTFKINIVHCEIKSIDSVGIVSNPKSKKGFTALTDDVDDKNVSGRIYGQNTYTFWWLKNTDHFFGIDKLGFAHRTKGRESYQNFSTNIYRSQKKSAVELAIGENKKIQIADIKMQHAIIKSLPRGKYIDLRYIRGAVSGLVEENNQWTQQDLINLVMEQNFMIGDTEGFDGKNDGQLKPFAEIAGGLDMREIQGYLEVMASGYRNISIFTGINDQLTGQSTNPDGLIGLQKLLINSSLNALYYCNEAIEMQYQKLFTLWASYIKNAVEKGGKTKEAIVNLIGSKKVSIIDALDEIPLHNIGVTISVRQREEERAEFKNELNRLKLGGVISPADEFMLNNIKNPKDQFAMLAVRYKKWEQKNELDKQRQFEQAQALSQQQGQNMVQAQGAKTDGKIKEIYADADAESKIITLAHQLGLSKEQFIATSKYALQRDRNSAQKDKAISTLFAKAEAKQQESLPLN